jgi:hypothetical protein
MPAARELTMTAVLATALCLGLVACGDDSSGEADGRRTTSTSAAPTTTPTAGRPTSPGCPVPIVPSVRRYCYRNGTAHAEVSGAVTATVDAPINATTANALFPAPMDMILPYTGANGTAVLVIGNTYPGTFPSNLPWAVRIETAPGQSWNAGEGECDITVETATEEKIEGSFSCRKVPGTPGPGTVDATGTFVATP